MGSNDSVGVFDTGMGNPLPLPYTINGKHSEITSTNATRQDTKASKTATVVDAMEQLHHETPAAENSGSLVNDPGPSVRRKVHAVIGNPLPLEYLDGENKVLKNKVSADTDPGTVDPFVVEKPLNAVDVSVSGGASDQTQAENDVVEKPTVKRPRNLKLSDIGDPLPLSYSPQVVGLESRLTHGVAKAPHQRMPLKIYDLGTPLPLEYTQDGEKTVGQETIRTDTYLKWKTTASDLPFDEWVEAQKKPDQATDEQNPKNVTCHNAVPNPPQELAGPKCSTGANCQATSGGSLVPAGEEPEDTTAVQSPGPQKPLGMSMYEHIALLVSRRDRLQLENRSRNAEFKKELIRYAEEAKEQVDFLSELLGENVTATPTGKQALTVSTTISTCVLLSAVMLLCTLSYLLAD